MNVRTQIINELIQRIGAKTYLEIGCQNRENNFNHIVCEKKICVDIDPAANPDVRMSSDDYFENYQMPFNVVFVDGDHSHEQSLKDIMNALDIAVMLVICHDTNPIDEKYAGPEWSGEVFKTIVEVNNRTDYHYYTYLEDPHGLTVIQKRVKRGQIVPLEPVETFADFEKNRQTILNVHSWKD